MIQGRFDSKAWPRLKAKYLETPSIALNQASDMGRSLCPYQRGWPTSMGANNLTYMGGYP